mmetsp:Transcript_15010/g.58821  ORF Transcript_15010/g.58821 Transcript_15010/m.58821 type:complete len:311 (-) Transcript_15010:38-970(-)
MAAQRADLGDVHQPAQRRALARALQQLVEMRQARGRAGGHRPRRHRVDADAARAQLGREVAHAGLQRGLHRAHQAVAGHHLFGTEVAHGDQAATLRHQRLGQARHAQQGVAGDVHRAGEAGGAGVDDAAHQVGLGREGDGVDEKVQPAPLPRDGVEHRLQLAGLLHVQRQAQRGAHLLGQRLHMRPGLVVEPGQRQLGAGRVAGLGTAPGDALVVRDADDEAAAALQFAGHVSAPSHSCQGHRRAQGPLWRPGAAASPAGRCGRPASRTSRATRSPRWWAWRPASRPARHSPGPARRWRRGSAGGPRPAG